MKKEDILRQLRETGVIAVIRTDSPEQFTDVAASLVEGGIRFIEITMTTPNALELMHQCSKAFADQIQIGSGTVLDSETAQAAVSAGARFVVSPVFNPDVVRFCNRYAIPVMPGALTPTEVLTAWIGGADVVKVFPARIGGPKYFKDLKGPLPQVEILPTGGVNLQTAPEFIKAGACAVGIGAALVDPVAVEKGEFDVIRKNAISLIQKIREARGDRE
jgi:2-dehydro-3-deoxyphosphogluconate aldolase/(4S)-4-hydroxy-2-oxoglutarate aldolase